MQSTETVLGVLRHWRARYSETGTPGSEGGRWKRNLHTAGNLAMRPTLPAPRGALSYPQCSWEEFGGTFLGPMTYLDPKGEGDGSMSWKRWAS